MTTYLLDNNKGLVLAIDRKNIKEDLAKFIWDNKNIMKELYGKKVKFKSIKKLVQNYNSHEE